MFLTGEPTVRAGRVNENSVIHNNILRLFDCHISPCSSDFKDLQRAAKVYLSRAKAASCKSGFQICCELEKEGFIEVGDYEKLKEILGIAGLMELKDLVEEKESKILKGNNAGQ